MRTGLVMLHLYTPKAQCLANIILPPLDGSRWYPRGDHEKFSFSVRGLFYNRAELPWLG